MGLIHIASIVWPFKLATWVDGMFWLCYCRSALFFYSLRFFTTNMLSLMIILYSWFYSELLIHIKSYLPFHTFKVFEQILGASSEFRWQATNEIKIEACLQGCLSPDLTVYFVCLCVQNNRQKLEPHVCFGLPFNSSYNLESKSIYLIRTISLCVMPTLALCIFINFGHQHFHSWCSSHCQFYHTT
jgi:hypothetical protein